MFELIWDGKAEMLNGLTKEPSSQLQPDLLSLCGNHFIEGDNYKALCALRSTLNNSVDLIYIDPPYNTGQRFVYDDDFRKPCGHDSSHSGQLSAIHSQWLNMMYPRLKVARELLSPSGVLFVSIDDVAQAPLKLILDEIFGPQQYIQTFLWRHGKGKKDKFSRTQHQYILAVAKDKSKLPSWRQRITKTYGKTVNPDHDPRGPWFSGSVSFSEQRSNPKHPNYFTLTSPSGVRWTRQWLCNEVEMNAHLSAGNIYFGAPPSYSRVPRLKIFQHAADVIPLNILDDVGTSRSATRECAANFDGEHLFDYPKPVALLQHLLELAIPNGGTVLDFFAGSGTTGVACMTLEQLNNRAYPCILVQKPEIFDINRHQKQIQWAKNRQVPANVASLTWHRIQSERADNQHWTRHHIVD